MLLMGEILRRRADGPDAERTALFFEEERWSYARLNAAVNRVANALIALGVRRGDRVALLGRNSAEWVLVYFAAAKAGAILVPVSYWFKADELRHILADSGASLLIAEDRFADVVADSRASAPSLRRVLWIGAAQQPGDATLTEVMDGVADGEPEALVDERDGHIIMYTSGTTGFPKGVLLSHRAHVLHAATWAMETRAAHSDVYLCTYPLFHTGGTDCGVVPPLYAGASVVLLPWPDAGSVLDAIERHRVTAFRAVPTVWKRLLAREDFDRRDLSSLRRVIAGSDAMPAELVAAIRARIPHAGYVQNYGLTEAGPVLTYLRPEDPPAKHGSNGTPHAQAEVRIVDGHDRPLPANRIGEIVARTEHAMTEYWGLPAATADAMRGGWLHTGDLGYVDADGYLWITGRKKDVIISGSEHIYPAEVEGVLALHPDVEAVAVIGVSDPEWGESVVAVVEAAPGASLDPAELIGFVGNRLSAFKRPKRVFIVDELPRTGPTRKVQKAALRERFRDALSVSPAGSAAPGGR